jgi:serine phosphatase RsbU (regulator of sigma subunit)
MRRALPVLSAVVSAVVAFTAALLFERALARIVGFDLRELEWISDVVLAVAFGTATFLWLHLRRARSALTRLERAKLVLDTELAIAADIQQELLPPPPRPRDGFRFAARLENAGQIGGDFYDFVDGGGRVLVLLADVSGKGIPAALVMASARALFRQIARETGRPEDLLGRLSRALWEEHAGKPYLTGILASLDLRSHVVTWVNAGHPAGLVVHGTEHRALAATGPPAGLLPTADYAAQELPLAEGDAVVLVTDGVTEALESDGRVEERIAWTVAQRRTKGPQAVCERVMRLAASGRGPVGAGGEWTDDRTVVAVTLD